MLCWRFVKGIADGDTQHVLGDAHLSKCGSYMVLAVFSGWLIGSHSILQESGLQTQISMLPVQSAARAGKRGRSREPALLELE